MSILRYSFHQEGAIRVVPVEWIIILPSHQPCLSYRMLMNSRLTFLALSGQKTKTLRERILHQCQKVSLCIFIICLFWVSISLYGFPYHSFFWLPVSYQAWYKLILSFLKPSSTELLPFLEANIFLHLLFHYALEGHSYSEYFDNLQLFALRGLSKTLEESGIILSSMHSLFVYLSLKCT